MKIVLALTALAVVLVLVANFLPGEGAVDYPLILLAATIALVVAAVQGIRLFVARRRRRRTAQV